MIRPSGGHDHSRKHFLSRVLGLAARGEAAREAAVSSLTNKAGGIADDFRIPPKRRAVARQLGAA
jgi:hypothetical protein